MTSHRVFTSGPNNWDVPRQPLDPCRRRHAHGRVRPMEEPSWFDRLLRRG